MAYTPDWDTIRIPARTTRLSNGLTIVAHQDGKAPLITVFLAYRAGSREEPPGQFGLAHICEHLMYCGTRGAAGSYFQLLEEAGATSINAFVAEDYCAYFATFPKAAFELGVQLEAERMSALADAITPVMLDRQRAIVRNELLQREATVEGVLPRLIAELAFPPRHPYAHPPNGLIEMLDSITLAEIRAWLTVRHSPSKAKLVIAGDIEPESAIEQVAQHFAHITEVTRPSLHIDQKAIRSDSREMIMQGNGAAEVCFFWHGPLSSSESVAALEVVGQTMWGPDSSSSHRFICDNDLISECSCELRHRQFDSTILLRARPGRNTSTGELRQELTSEIDRLLRSGISESDLIRARSRCYARQIRNLDRTGGRTGKAAILCASTMLGGSTKAYDRLVDTVSNAELEVINRELKGWLSTPPFVIEFQSNHC